jgi:MYXO-CTERM domain-containing protein
MKKFFLGLGLAVAALVSAPSASYAACDGVDGAEVISADCGTINDIGCCDVAVVVWCSTGGEGLCAIDCTQGDTTCGWSEEAGFFDCDGADAVPEGTTLECPMIEIPDTDVVEDSDTIEVGDIGLEDDSIELEDDLTELEDDSTGIEDDTTELEDVAVGTDTQAGVDTTGGADTTGTDEDTKKSSSGCTVGNSSSASVLALLLALFLVPVLRRRYNV